MSPNNKKRYIQQRFVFMSLDPIHIGIGGHRLGRVDNTIVREPGTRLPKIPGTSIAGTARSYAAMQYGKPQAAGAHKNFIGDKNKCPIIYTFGTAVDTGGGQAGKVNICDAHLLLFPVYSCTGPVWVSTKDILEVAGFYLDGAGEERDDVVYTSLDLQEENLNLGWLLFAATTGLKVTFSGCISEEKEWQAVKNRIVIVPAKLFSQIVNSNLEVRTSVAIDPETGAAKDRALFTYEALPRSTWLWMDVIEDDFVGCFPKTERQFSGVQENSGDSLAEAWERPLHVVRAGLRLMEYLGVGGMGTRGFGRLKVMFDWEVQ
ncbi:MAG: type III-B CRISPR module RAMP protein Cmr4 [Dethiobacter sp.]|jgi:CRISPR-associated protein Cmr4|nr:MAG: type III-B CRISPR module RAMP protein Cmr4 [Dethiobacter sp.]